MFVFGNLQAENLEADELIVDHIEVPYVNNTSAAELSYIKNAKSNIQEQLTELKNKADTVLKRWQ